LASAGAIKITDLGRKLKSGNRMDKILVRHGRQVTSRHGNIACHQQHHEADNSGHKPESCR